MQPLEVYKDQLIVVFCQYLNRMGATTSSLDSLLQDYHLQKTSPSNAFSLLKHKTTESCFLLRQVPLSTTSQLDSLLERSYTRKSLIHQHYLTLKEILRETEGGFCSTIYRVSLLYEYCSHTLQHQIETRKSQKRTFQEPELWSIIYSTVLVFSFLSKKNIYYDSISPLDIFLSDGTIKIGDPDVSSLTRNSGFSVTTHNYLSPQSLRSKQNPEKSCVFSLGLCVMGTILMESMDICYNDDDGGLNLRELSRNVRKLGSGMVSVSLVEIVQWMLTIDVKKRPSVSKLEEKLLSLLKESPANQILPSTPSSSTPFYQQVMESGNGREVLEECGCGEMQPQEQEQVSKVIQIFNIVDVESPDDVDDDSQTPVREEVNSRILANSQKHNIKNSLSQSQKGLTPSQKEYEQAQYAYRQHTQQTNFTPSIPSEPIFTKKQTNDAWEEPSPLSEPKDDSELRFVNESYVRGRYEGQKRGQTREGYGTFYYKEGGRYTGDWKDNKMEGRGTLYYDNNKIAYEGDWISDHLWGRGCLYNQNPRPINSTYDFTSFDEVDEYWVKFEGVFVQDNKCGKGRLTLSNNQLFQGSFKDDFVHGDGTYFTKDGRVIEGEWVENKLSRQYSRKYKK